MDRILDGVRFFQDEVFPRKQKLFEALAEQQQPQVLLVTCADSRVMPQLITQADPGELFECRNAGNIVPAYGEVNGGVSATIEYAVAMLGVRHVIVCGHSNCAAMRGLLDPALVADLPTFRSWLSHGEAARRIVRENFPGLPEDKLLETLIEQNVVAQLSNLRTHPSVAAKLQRRELQLHGWVYDIGTGRIDEYDERRQQFAPIRLKHEQRAAPLAPLSG